MVQISSNKAVVTATNILIKITPKYYITQEQINKLDDLSFIKASYRRFLRLRPFVSKRQTIKHSYTIYLRYKFRVENYESKRRECLSESEFTDIDFRSSVQRSLQMMIKAFSNTNGFSRSMEKDTHMCRRIVKNILTVDYHKTRLIRNSGKMYKYYRKDLKYLTDDQHIGIRQFEENLIRFNECFGTML